METNELALLTRLLDVLGGPGKGQELVRALLATGDAEGVARQIASSDYCERLYKEMRAGRIQPVGRKEADPAFVGLPDLDRSLSFEEQYREFFRPRLGARADGFDAIFRGLPRQSGKLLIVETGCLRIPGNWVGDGQSTFMFDAFAQAEDAIFISIDITVESVDSARRACSSVTNFVLADSIVALHNLSRLVGRHASLLYLDSYDVDFNNPMPSAIHHALELVAARTLMGPGTIICVDDYSVGGQACGKGLLIDQYFSSIRAAVLHSGYQKVWQLT